MKLVENMGFYAVIGKLVRNGVIVCKYINMKFIKSKQKVHTCL